MFGYISVNGSQLSEENRQTYQAFYCGLCQELKKQCGASGQALLTYDMTFLIVLLTGLYETEYERRSFTCPLHPFKKREEIRSQITEYAASMNIVLAYYNLMDDWKDESNVTKLALAKLLEKKCAEIRHVYPRQTQAIQTYLEQVTAYEKSGNYNIDVIAGMTGEMLGELLCYKEDVWSAELHTLGFYLGKYIYLMDAYEDLQKDRKNGSYNPLIPFLRDNPEDYETLCKLMLTSYMSECAKSFERLPILLHADILRNILYSGVWTKYEYIQLKKKKRNKK